MDLKDVLSELHEVTDWFYLGMCLGIPIATLQAVKKDYKHTDVRKREVFLKWMEIEEPTWSKIVRVLREMGKRALANRIAQNHGNIFSMDMNLLCLCNRFSCSVPAPMCYVCQ